MVAPIVVAAGISAVGSIIGGKMQSNASNAAAGAQTASTKASIDFQERWLRINRGDVADAVDAGLVDIDTAFNAAFNTVGQGSNAAMQIIQQAASGGGPIRGMPTQTYDPGVPRPRSELPDAGANAAAPSTTPPGTGVSEPRMIYDQSANDNKGGMVPNPNYSPPAPGEEDTPTAEDEEDTPTAEDDGTPEDPYRAPSYTSEEGPIISQGGPGAEQAITAGYGEARGRINTARDTGRSDLITGTNIARQDITAGYGKTEGLLTPLTGLEEYNQAKALVADPSSLRDRPTYDFLFQEGNKALEAQGSTRSGGGPSGSMIKAATQYGQNFANTFLDEELARLQPFIDIATTSRSQLAQMAENMGLTLGQLAERLGMSLADLETWAGSNMANIATGEATNLANIRTHAGDMMSGIAERGSTNQANLTTNQGTGRANLRMGGAVTNANLTSNAAGNISSGILNMGNIAANNAINQGNISANTIGNVSTSITDAILMDKLFNKGKGNG